MNTEVCLCDHWMCSSEKDGRKIVPRDYEQEVHADVSIEACTLRIKEKIKAMCKEDSSCSIYPHI